MRILLPLIGAILGGVLGYLVALLQTSLFLSGALVGWQGLGAPPGVTMDIRHIAPYPAGVYVETTTGAIWYADIGHCESASLTCWEQVQTVPDFDGWYHFERYPCAQTSAEFTEFSRMKSPPGLARLCARVQESGPDGIYEERHAAVLEDDSVWTWYHGSSKYSTLYACAYVPIGALAGIILGFWLWWRLRRTKDMASEAR